ncbi:hypothetical protein [Halalkalicoccus sp. NIPERK01]|uniref:hypothetical protein n=1 Tax=Halalkalicoccus sp. NIPERK01 TaxID=3053469 RepID=UPI00256F1C09|nr:hypothetical protein [Halalkalicoccus sp. NIPERK01]MDL5362997.1 hypothetical protein [Halalkalicoccus sp. NIPERK01]
MGVIDTVRELFDGPEPTKSRSKGAYWCDDCDERILDLEADAEPPDCPTCGEEMRFERSPDAGGCAC